MGSRCRPTGCDVFFPDEHPTVTGHGRAAEIVFHEMLQPNGLR